MFVAGALSDGEVIDLVEAATRVRHMRDRGSRNLVLAGECYTSSLEILTQLEHINRSLRGECHLVRGFVKGCGHYWVEIRGQWILDVTLTQFGHMFPSSNRIYPIMLIPKVVGERAFGYEQGQVEA